MKIEAYKQPEAKQGSHALGFFTVAMFTVNSYMTFLDMDRGSLLYLATNNIDSEGMEEEDAAGFEEMIDAIDNYLESMSGSDEYKFKVVCGASVLMLNECIDVLIQDNCFLEQEKSNIKLAKDLANLERLEKAAENLKFSQKRKVLPSLKSLRFNIPRKIKNLERSILIESQKTYFMLRDLLIENSCESNDCKNLYNYIKNNLYTDEAI